MRSKSIVLLVMALGCGLVASIGISQIMEARNKASGEQSDRQAVFVAMTDIGTNEELTAQNVKLEEWPKNIVPQGALTRLEEVEGKRSRMKLYAGEPILSSKLLGAADTLGAAKDIPPGYRVAHVKVDSVTGASNLILPGDRVDVLLFRQPPSGDQHTTAAKIVLQDIKVFAVDTHTETEFSRNKSDQGGEPITAKTISLLVTPQQSLILHAASEVGGAVRLVLRNPEDDAYVATHAATLGDIFGPDQHSDRNKEQGTEKEGGNDKEDVTAWLDQQKQADTAPVRPASAKSGPAAVRKMIVIYGADLRQVNLPGDGGVPENQRQTQPPNSTGPTDSHLTSGEGDVPLAPPIEGAQQNEPGDGK
jgi:pilus assembly protein CpaB